MELVSIVAHTRGNYLRNHRQDRDRRGREFRTGRPRRSTSAAIDRYHQAPRPCIGGGRFLHPREGDFQKYRVDQLG